VEVTAPVGLTLWDVWGEMRIGTEACGYAFACGDGRALREMGTRWQRQLRTTRPSRGSAFWCRRDTAVLEKADKVVRVGAAVCGTRETEF